MNLESIILSVLSSILITTLTIFSKKINDKLSILANAIYEKIINQPNVFILKYTMNTNDYGRSFNIKENDNSDKSIKAILYFLKDKLNYKVDKKLNIICFNKKTNISNDKNELYKNTIYYPEIINDMKYQNMYISYREQASKTDDKGNKSIHTLIIKSYTDNYQEICKFIKTITDLYIDEFYPKKNIYNKYIINNYRSGLYVNSWRHFSVYDFKSNRNFNSLFINEKDQIKSLIDKLNDSNEMKIKKLGFLLYGSAGTGKTTLIKCIANYANRHLISLKLNNIQTLTELMDIFHNKEINNVEIPINKRIYIIEDIDCDSDIVKKRSSLDEVIDEISDNKKLKNSSTAPLVTLSDLLNCLDGILELQDVILIFTTNHVENLDPALIRPGRITLQLSLENMSINNMTNMIKYHFNDLNVDEKYLIENSINPSKLEVMCKKSNSIEELELELDTFLNDL